MASASSTWRLRSAMLGVALYALPHNASAQDTSPGRRAYTLTLMCSVVAAHYGGDADGKRTADAVRKMAAAQGVSNDQVAQDAIEMANVLGVQSRTDAEVLPRNREICRKAGLLS